MYEVCAVMLVCIIRLLNIFESMFYITLLTYAQQGYALGCISLCTYLYMSTKNYLFTAQKFPAECISLLSHWF